MRKASCNHRKVRCYIGQHISRMMRHIAFQKWEEGIAQVDQYASQDGRESDIDRAEPSLPDAGRGPINESILYIYDAQNNQGMIMQVGQCQDTRRQFRQFVRELRMEIDGLPHP